MKVFSLEIFLLYGIYLFLIADLDYDSNTKLRELPLPFEIPLPMGAPSLAQMLGATTRDSAIENTVGQPQGSVHNRGNVVTK